MFLFLCLNCYDSSVTRGWGIRGEHFQEGKPKPAPSGKCSPPALTPPKRDRPFSHRCSKKKKNKKNHWDRVVPLTQESFLFLLSSP